MRRDGFSLVEALFAMAIAMAVMGSALRLALPTESLAASRSETADMQQRLRVAADALSQRLGDAGAAAYSSVAPGPVTDTTAAVFPYRTGVSASDPPGSFRRDAMTVLSVPRNGAEPVGTTFWLKREDATATYQLIAVESANGVDVPVVDNVVALAFEYFGDPQPPMMRKPLADPIGPWTTYGPKPYLKSCQVLLPGTAPMPVRTTSPLASTTSMPQKWAICSP